MYFRKAKRVATLLLAITVSGCLYEEQKAGTPFPAETLRAEAARNTPARWKIPVGSEAIDDLDFQSDGKILVGLREQPHFPKKPTVLMLDRSSGRELWRYRPETEAAYTRLFTLSDIILYRADAGETAKLVAIDAASGKLRWQSQGFASSVIYIPSPIGGDMLAVNNDGGKTEISALALSNGALRWSRNFAGASGESHVPVVDQDGILVFAAGVERLTAQDGKSRWRRKDLVLSAASAAPRIAGEHIYVADSSGSVHKLSRKSGKTVWKAGGALAGATITNLFPLGEQIYLRGGKTGDSSGRASLVAVDSKSGKIAWRFDSPAALPSNLIEADGALYYATASGVGALDATTGRQRFFTELTNSGRTYPVRVRRYGKNIVFIGELMIGAVDMATGQTVYAHGFDPVNNEATLTAADARLTSLLADPGNPIASGASVAAMASAESARYQEEANRYEERAREHMRDHNRGTRASSSMSLIRAQGALNQAQINKAFSRASSNLAFMGAWLGASAAMAEAANRRFAEQERERQTYLRKSILTNYLALEAGDFVARPVREEKSRYSQFVGVAVIHMPTGRLEQTNISAAHDVFGLWNLIDLENGIVYHNGVGLDPAAHEYSGQLGFFGGKDYLKTFLIAQPLKLPK